MLAFLDTKKSYAAHFFFLSLFVCFFEPQEWETLNGKLHSVYGHDDVLDVNSDVGEGMRLVTDFMAIDGKKYIELCMSWISKFSAVLEAQNQESDENGRKEKQIKVKEKKKEKDIGKKDQNEKKKEKQVAVPVSDEEDEEDDDQETEAFDEDDDASEVDLGKFL